MKPIPPEMLTHITRLFDTRPEALSFLGGGEDFSDGVVYLYPSNGIKRVLKILPVPSGQMDAITQRAQLRLRYIRYLSDHDVPIAAPVPDRIGQLYQTVTGESGSWLAYSMEKAPGIHTTGASITPDFARRFGQTVGTLHRVSHAYMRTCGSHLEPDPSLGWESEWKSFYDDSPDPEIRTCWQELHDRLLVLPRTPSTYGFTHNDMHVFNLLQHKNQLVLIDFDVARYHWYAVDLPTAMQYTLFTHGGMDRPWTDLEPIRRFFSAFMNGYAAEYALPPDMGSTLDLFLQYRRLLMFTVNHGSIHGNPEDARIWKHLIQENPPLIPLLL